MRPRIEHIDFDDPELEIVVDARGTLIVRNREEDDDAPIEDFDDDEEICVGKSRANDTHRWELDSRNRAKAGHGR